MTRGCFLERDLELLINNPKYSEIEILCKDEKKLYSCSAILAARFKILDRLLYNGIKESFKKQISFPTINSTEMKIILEYIYTGSIKENSLTKDNIVETYYAADYFQISGLQEFIMNALKSDTLAKSYARNCSPELLSKSMEIMPSPEELLKLLVEEIATNLLNDIEIGRLSITALQYFLFYTYEKEIPFATSEYEVFDNLIQVENKLTPNNQKVAKELDPLIEYIDFRRIKRNQFALVPLSR
ncbi:hypothetical protein RclHR1_01760010 [Rhizophagus clarus]|uniref:BTB domain-containing protein n=1 Tax=Rhizophagus clarus TaxID=94130 RepID=A0A2Z6RD66_9GLOM|nr:hypothetical protein RclHR1_01760010 [Rhizophagus clarus]